MQPTATYPDVSNIYANPSGAPPAASSSGGYNPLANIYASPDQSQQQPQQQQPQAPKPHGNFFTHALPTIGGILGGLGGELLGPLGGIGGAAGGSALGKTIENKLEGQGAGNGVIENAIEGGVGQGVGGILGKVGGKVIKAIGDKSGAVADNLVKGQVVKGSMTGDTANALRTMGLSDARQFQPVADVVTGQNGALNQGVIQGLKEAETPVDFSGLSNHARNLVAENQMQLRDASIPGINKAVQGALIKSVNPEDISMIEGKGGKISMQSFEPGSLKNVLPENAFNVTKNFEDLAAAAKNAAFDKMGNVADPDQYAKYQIFQGLADQARHLSFGGDTPIPLSPELKSSIVSNLQPLADINPTVHGNLVDQVTNAQNLQDLRGIQAPFVQASKAMRATDMAADRGAGTTAQQVMSQAPLTGAVAAGPHGMLAGLSAAALRSPAADRALVPIVSKGGQILSSVGGSGALPAVGGATGVLAGTSNNLIQTGPTGSVGGDMQPTAEQPPVQTGPTNGLSRDDLITLALYSPTAFNSILSAAQPQQQQVIAANQAQTALQGLGEAPQGGLLSHITGNLGLGGTGEYQRKAESAAQQVAAALPGTDAKAIERQLTDYAAGGGNIDEAIKGLLQRLSSVVNNNSNGAYQQLMNYGGA